MIFFSLGSFNTHQAYPSVCSFQLGSPDIQRYEPSTALVKILGPFEITNLPVTSGFPILFNHVQPILQHDVKSATDRTKPHWWLQVLLGPWFFNMFILISDRKGRTSKPHGFPPKSCAALGHELHGGSAGWGPARNHRARCEGMDDFPVAAGPVASLKKRFKM